MYRINHFPANGFLLLSICAILLFPLQSSIAQDSLNISVVAKLPGGWGTVTDVAVVNDTLVYVCAGDYGIAVINQADPDNPQEIACLGGLCPDIIEIKGSILYTFTKYSNFQVYSIANPLEPQLLQTVDYEHGYKFWIEGNCLFVKCSTWFDRYWDIYQYFYDISDPAVPEYIMCSSIGGYVGDEGDISDASANDSMFVYILEAGGTSLQFYSFAGDTPHHECGFSYNTDKIALSRNKLVSYQSQNIYILDITNLPELDTLACFTSDVLGGTNAKFFVSDDTLTVNCENAGENVVTLIDLSADGEASVIGQGDVDADFTLKSRNGRQVYGNDTGYSEVQNWEIQEGQAEEQYTLSFPTGPMLVSVCNDFIYALRDSVLLEWFTLDEQGVLNLEGEMELTYTGGYKRITAVEDRFYLARISGLIVAGVEVYAVNPSGTPELLGYYDFEDWQVPLSDDLNWAVMSNHVLEYHNSTTVQLVDLSDMDDIFSTTLQVDNVRCYMKLDPYVAAIEQNGDMLVYATDNLSNITPVMTLDDYYLWWYLDTPRPKRFDYRNNKIYCNFLTLTCDGETWADARTYRLCSIDDDNCIQQIRTLYGSRLEYNHTTGDQFVTPDVWVVNDYYYLTESQESRRGIMIRDAETGDPTGHYAISPPMTSMAQMDSLIIVGTSNYILVLNAYEAGLLGVGEESQEASAVPQEFTIDSVYPNPFNPTTRIRFSVTRSGLVNGQIYAVDGRLVTEFERDIAHPGSYEYSWNGCDSRGMPVASGVYFLSMRQGKDMGVRRLILMK